MNLVIDIGNTRIKTAVFEGNKLINQESLELNFTLLEKKIIEFKGKIILSSVVESDFIDKWAKNLPIIIFSSSLPLPIEIKYKTPQTLGLDRLANVMGANNLKSSQHALVIDCGTCLKIDLLSNNAYLGGSISPGLKMRLTSLHNFTSKLPLVEVQSFDQLIGSNTEESILSGCFRGMLAEIQKTIDDYQATYSGLEIFITGGDHSLFVNHLKNRIFADPFLTLKGLNEILNYQNT